MKVCCACEHSACGRLGLAWQAPACTPGRGAHCGSFACGVARKQRLTAQRLLVPRAACGAQASFLSEFLRDERLRVFIRAGQLELVLWDHLGECVGPPHMRCWQPIVYSHAILEAWGSGLHLLISDIDEYFVLPKANTTFAGVLEGNCTNTRAMVRPRSRLPIFIVEGLAHARASMAQHAACLPARGRPTLLEDPGSLPALY